MILVLINTSNITVKKTDIKHKKQPAIRKIKENQLKVHINKHDFVRDAEKHKSPQEQPSVQHSPPAMVTFSMRFTH